MSKTLALAAFGVGAAAIAWVGAGYLPGNLPALAMTLLIGAFYLAGALELRRFAQATHSLDRALSTLPEPLPALPAWLAGLPASLQHSVRQRIDGERAGLPGPALTPYFTGLLVLLGMLGTFGGMVVTLQGTSLALERATDLASMRDSLAAPVRGLGLAFGTSVAGVAASAMLGLVSALLRRERTQVAQRLDARIATTLQPFTRTHQRQQSLALLQQQTQLMPALVQQLQAMAQQLQTQAQDAHGQLLARQDRWHDQAGGAFRTLADSVDQSLRRSLDESARVAASTLQPAVQAAMDGIARETSALHGQVTLTVQQQLDAVAQGFARHSAELVDRVAQAQTAQAQQLDRSGREQLDRMLAGLSQQQNQICQTLEQTAARITAQAETQAQATIGEVSRLTALAADAPRAAAELVAQLREKLTDSLARDNALLEERARVMATLNTLLDAVQHSATEQKGAIDTLVASTAAWLEQAGHRFTEQAQAQASGLQTAAQHLSGSAVEVASLGESFGAGVDQFCRSADQLLGQLQQVEQTLSRSIARSDDQLAYYVAQAREVIDLSLASQKQVVDDLQRLARERSRRPSPQGSEA